MTTNQVDFEPIGRRGPCPGQDSLLDCARHLGVDLVSLCGGKGTCGKCKVQVVAGQVTEPTADEVGLLTPEELRDGYRLACQARPLSNCRVRVPPESLSVPQRVQVEGLEFVIPLEPPVISHNLQLSPPSLSDFCADAERVLRVFGQMHGRDCYCVDLEVLRQLPSALRSEGWRARVSVRDREIVALGPVHSRQLGLAVDLGTTKVAGYLVDMEDGKTLAACGTMNPQVAYGEDVIARIARLKGDPSEAPRLQGLAVGAINQLAADLCAEAAVSQQEIVEAVVVGNTAMHHLLLRLPVEQLALAPYVPAVSEALDIKAREIGLQISPGAYVHLLPNIAGFVGADHVAMLLATGVMWAEGTVLALDIGTNTEVCVKGGGRMASVSCASGPAFEGAHIKHGMRAAGGAIEYLRIIDGAVEIKTINGAPPVGLCGSGILDAMAQMYLAGILDERGRIGNHSRVRGFEGEREFVVVSEDERGGQPAITITQKDVRELQLAKGAIRTGVQVLLEAQGCKEEDIDKVIISGAFGCYIDVRSAVTIGMLPPLPLERFAQVGNAAGAGARMALISQTKRAEARTIASRVGYIELAAYPGFTDIFAKSMNLG